MFTDFIPSLDQPTAEAIESYLINRKDITVIMITHNLSEKVREQLDGVFVL
ncbi:MAG: hypothetical protein ACK5MW_09000 [Enterococcus sp.]